MSDSTLWRMMQSDPASAAASAASNAASRLAKLTARSALNDVPNSSIPMTTMMKIGKMSMNSTIDWPRSAAAAIGAADGVGFESSAPVS